MKHGYILLGVAMLLAFGILFVGCSKDKEEKVETITFWTTESQPERLQVQEDIAAQFKEQTGITVEIVPTDENLLSERVTAAFASGKLPDVIFAPLAQTRYWLDEGIVNSAAATEAIENLGKDTYAPGVLSLVEQDDEYAGVPVDGWTQLLVYRKDLFDKHGLAPPNGYKNILEAIKVLHDPPNLYGFVAATDPSQVYMMQVLEHLSLANGIDIVDENGNITLDTPDMQEFIDFYKKLAEASPAGNLFWEQSRELYLAGKAAMIVWSPFIMDELAGLRDSVPVTFNNDPTSRELASSTDYITRISGPSNPTGSGYVDVRYFVITVDALAEASKQFVEFSMDDGYLQTLAIAPEGKHPVRRGDATDPNHFVKGWSNLEVGVDRRSTLSELYSEDVIKNLLEGLNTGSRWGFSKGYGALSAKMTDTRAFAEIIRRAIDGELTTSEAAKAIQEDTERLNN